LEASTAKAATQPTLRLLHVRKTTWNQGVRQVSTKTVETNKTSHLLDQIHLAKKIHPTGGRYNHRPAILSSAEVAAECGKTILYLLITHIGSLLVFRSQRT
tara:strand:- start:202 stop:504 length:303 start_codon:yes stop_codon:yes gene_type:complete